MNTITLPSLLADATRGASLKRWSIQRLLGCKLGGADAVEHTRALLQEVQVRLAVQHGKLSALSKSIEPYAKVATVEGEQAQRNLKNLMQLHENTYLLPHQLVDGEGRALLRNFTRQNRKHVSDMLDQIMARHGTSVETMADCVIHARNMEEGLPGILTRQFSEAELLQNAPNAPVESFLHSRLMIQILCDHYVSLNKGKPMGAVSLGADVVDCVDDAVTEARHQPSSESIPAEVHITIDKEERSDSGQEHLRIQIIDQGIGLKDKDKAFGFAQSTSQKRWNRLEEQQSYAAVRQPLGSLGVGLPLSRLMLRVFGGELDLSNHEKSSSIDSGCTATMRINYDDSYLAKN
ncbi:hypothetical protein ACHAXT_008158 [Thalassiosira profunda]